MQAEGITRHALYGLCSISLIYGYFDISSTVYEKTRDVTWCFTIVLYLFGYHYIFYCHGRQVADADIVALGMKAGADVAKVVYREDLTGEYACRYSGSGVALLKFDQLMQGKGWSKLFKRTATSQPAYGWGQDVPAMKGGAQYSRLGRYFEAAGLADEVICQ